MNNGASTALLLSLSKLSFHDALSLFLTRHKALSTTTLQQAYASLFHQCSLHKSPHTAQRLHHHMLTHLPNPPDLILNNHIINAYAKCGLLEDARKVFDKMAVRNVVSWTALVSGYVQYRMGDEGFRVFREMVKEGVCRPNEFGFSSLLSGCGEWEGRQVHGVVLKVGYEGCVFAGNALIGMYGRCGCGDEGWRVFEHMEWRNLVSWNSVIEGFRIRGLVGRVVGAFVDMRREGVGFDRATVLSVLSSLSGSNVGEGELEFGFCSQLHCLCLKAGLIEGIEVKTALVKAYSDVGGDVDDCYKLFLESSFSHDIVSWTGIITALSESDPEKALMLFNQLRREDLVPDRYTCSSVLKACAGFATERHALAIHSQVIKAGFLVDIVIANALIHAYARSGSLLLSKQVFKEMDTYDLVSWNSMFKAYALHGEAKKALQLFTQMNVQPDSATFVALLSACSHSGLVQEGKEIFQRMSENHGVVPQLDHYACMVDILGRAGQIQEARQLISQMPMKPDAVIWSALLGACRKHGETELAKLAATNMKELDPENSLGYVQISNIYCSGGSFIEAGLIRKEMKGARVRKEPGLSWIDIGNQVHEFASGGRRHPERDAICAKLEVFIGQLKEIGYVPETSLALHDIEEEHKEEQLYFHSEKLALIFSLMNEGRTTYGQGVIRIMKNIRICADCHNFMKLASDLLQKEIVVRDSNRFHHFKDRTCSCKDYW